MQTSAFPLQAATTRKPRVGLLSIITAAYIAATFAALFLHWVVGERFMPISLMNDNLELLLIPSLVLLPLSLVRRKGWFSRLLILPVATFLFFYAPLFLPQNITVPPDAQQIKLLTYNMQAEEDLLEPMVQVIRDSGADIVALQEMSAKMAARLDEALTDIYPYRALHPMTSPYHGRGILSRYPLTNDRAWPEDYPIPVRLQRVEVDVDGTSVTIFNMHAPPSVPIFEGSYDIGPRKQQIADLVDMARQEPGAVLMMGDFNTTDMDENYARITAQFADTFREVGWGLGFTNPDWQHDNPRRGPSFVPRYQRIDYVFHNSFFTPIEARVGESSGGSDHRPLFAILALNP
ncbi:MAG: endonuclease/exonuclease/phosphatase family protein [Chloroflexota bacterium]